MFNQVYLIRRLSLACLAVLVISPSHATSVLPTDQQALKELLNQSLGQQNGVYIEAILLGFAKLAEGSRRLLTDAEHSVSATRCLLEGIAQLTACALKERHGKDNEQLLTQVQNIVQAAQTKVNKLAQDCANLNTKIPHRPVCPVSMRSLLQPSQRDDLSVAGVSMDANDTASVASDDSNAAVDMFDEIDDNATAGAAGMDKENEKLLVAGLTQIFYNMFCMLISPNDIGLYLKNVFAGLFKVLAAVIANGKIDQDDLESIGTAIGTIFNLRSYDLTPVTPLRIVLNTQASAARATPAVADAPANPVSATPATNPATPAVDPVLQAFEQQELSAGLSLICQSFMALILDPQHALTHLRQLCQGLFYLFLSIFADGKVNAHDADNLVAVIADDLSPKLRYCEPLNQVIVT